MKKPKKYQIEKVKEPKTLVEFGRTGSFKDKIKGVLGYVSRIISAIIFQPIAESLKLVMTTVEDRIIRIEKRMLRTLSSLLIIAFGAVFLILSLFFFLKEYLVWSNTAAFFAIGIAVFVAGLLLKVSGYDD